MERVEEKRILGHPPGLFVLFFTEMWERFSYYGMRALLVLYMTQYLLIEADKGKVIFGYAGIKSFVVGLMTWFGMTGDVSIQAISSQIYGLYTGFVYFTPFFGGLLADRLLGQRKSVYLGGILMAIGQFTLMSEELFFVGLFLLILGNGCFKPNISTQVGDLYPEGDPRRDGAFTIFYMGINLGAFLSPLICGTLGQLMGWRYGFMAAGIGMILGVIIYYWGQKYLATDLVTQRKLNKAKGHAQVESQEITKDEWKRIYALIFLCVINIMFWSVYEQQGNTLQLWADARTDWNILGWNVPSTWYQTFNPAMIFIFAPFMERFWSWQNKKGHEPSSVVKMSMGCFLLGIAFIIMIIASKIVPEDAKGSIMWLLTTTWLFTIGELYLSPIGLSLVTKVAPARMVSMMMGMWFLSSFFGNYLSGFIGGYYETMTKEAFFTLLMVLGVSAGLIFLAAKKPINNIISHHE